MAFFIKVLLVPASESGDLIGYYFVDFHTTLRSNQGRRVVS